MVFSGAQGLPLPLKSTPPALRVVLASGVGSGGDGDGSRATRGFSRLLTRNLTVFAINLDAAWDLGGTLAEYIHVSSNPELARHLIHSLSLSFSLSLSLSLSLALSLSLSLFLWHCACPYFYE